MIEFKGYLTGEAEKRFVKKTRARALIMCCVMIALALPMIFIAGKVVFRDPAFSHILFAGCILWAIIVLMPKGKHEHLSKLPQRIYTDGDFIVCVTDERTDSRLIHDVKKVTDHGEYYELCFNYGKYSDMFICQKNLLTRGTLQGFEKMFDCKIIRINEKK